MRSPRLKALAILGLAAAGCGPPDIVPMSPPGIPYRRVMAEGMEAEGEQRNKESIRPKTAEDADAPK